MKTKYKYINFELLVQKPKTQVWICRNNRTDSRLGFIEWHSPWREYCIFSLEDSFFNKTCLRDIVDFIEQLEKKRN